MDYQLKNLIYPKIESTMKQKGADKQVLTIVGEFINRNAEALSYIGPSSNIFFSQLDKNKMYNLCGVTEGEVYDAVKASTDIYVDKETMKYPFNSFIPMVVRYFMIHAKDEVYQKALSDYMAFSMYPILYTKYYKYPPNENVMAYTINHMSNKFKIRQTKNLLQAISETAYGAFALHAKALEKDGSDKVCLDIALSMRTRLNSFFRKLTNEYMKNHAAGNYLNAEIDSSTDEENYKEANTTTTDISNLANKVTTKLIINGPNMKLISIAANTNSVSVNELRNYILKICSDKRRAEIIDVIENMITLYVLVNDKSIAEIKSNDFLLYSLDMYSKHNLQNKQINDIKDILDRWLNDEINIQQKTKRVATINSFRKAIYTFLVTTIQQYGY